MVDFCEIWQLFRVFKNKLGIWHQKPEDSKRFLVRWKIWRKQPIHQKYDLCNFHRLSKCKCHPLYFYLMVAFLNFWKVKNTNGLDVCFIKYSQFQTKIFILPLSLIVFYYLFIYSFFLINNNLPTLYANGISLISRYCVIFLF